MRTPIPSCRAGAPPAAPCSLAESDAEIFALGELARHARTMKVDECMSFLDGMAALMKEGTAAQRHVQSISNFFHTIDHQLELLANAVLEEPKPAEPQTEE